MQNEEYVVTKPPGGERKVFVPGLISDQAESRHLDCYNGLVGGWVGRGVVYPSADAWAAFGDWVECGRSLIHDILTHRGGLSEGIFRLFTLISAFLRILGNFLFLRRLRRQKGVPPFISFCRLLSPPGEYLFFGARRMVAWTTISLQVSQNQPVAQVSAAAHRYLFKYLGNGPLAMNLLTYR